MDISLQVSFAFPVQIMYFSLGNFRFVFSWFIIIYVHINNARSDNDISKQLFPTVSLHGFVLWKQSVQP